ncbi:Ribosomal protein S6 glutaminyl transferase [Hyphomicrobium sulfonivorans]|uniref:Ribosomal protein S6 glutaminyl transferase n=1 Tax=Hyphomicrobium sulfonivorans TaxID=121290 RepID=A0A125NVE1_HYPSL|nr:RimK family alpha-L-glutamate ligase [Hyphomicrobium sulfonivorans]KWT69490.1 Ribosomal protein S6 glutaminyl transferase [Hyphomicrobium sulfonivorans]
MSSTKASANEVITTGECAGSKGLRIAVFLEEEAGHWHVRRLASALRAHGADVVVTSLPRCAFDTGIASGIDIPGFNGELPDAVFVRSISAGTLEQITFRLGILHALRECGVRVWNDARAIERCVDKSATTFLLHRAGVPTPRTRTMETKPPADAYVAEARRGLIYKPLFGSQGKGLLRIDDVAELPDPVAADSMYYLQDFVGPSGSVFEDWRVIVTRRRVVAAMARRADTWVTNVHLGGAPVAHEPDAQMAELSQRALAAVGGDYAGIDLIRAPDGRLLVLEVNSNPSWRGLQTVTDVDIAAVIAEDFLHTVIAHRQNGARAAYPAASGPHAELPLSANSGFAPAGTSPAATTGVSVERDPEKTTPCPA